MGQVTPIPLAFPERGMVTTGRRSEQPPGTCVDMLNMRVFDSAERATGAQRAGTSKLWAAALGSGVQPIQLLDQTTIALDPATITASTQLLNEPFTYADGALQTVATAAVWKTYQAGGTGDTTVYNVATNQIQPNVGGAAGQAVYQPALALGTAYIVKFTFTTKATTLASVSVQVRQNKTTPASAAVYLTFGSTAGGVLTLNIGTTNGNNDIGTYTSAAGFVTTLTAYTLELRVNGNVFQGYVNGIKYVQGTSAASAAQSGIGFASGGSGAGANNLTLDNFQVFVGTNLSSYRQTNIIAVCGGNVYQGDAATQATLVSGGAGQLSDTIICQGTYSQALFYFVDGLTIAKLSLAIRAMVTYVATAGTAPTFCTLACVWRDRLVLAAPRDLPQNIFFSRIGTHTDWDYSQTDSAAAFAGNQSAAGRIGEPIVALIPMGDDVLGVGGDHNFWAIRGDLAAGGSIDVISNRIGILGPRAWCQDPTGTIWFIGTGGVYKWMNGQGVPEPVSRDSFNLFFKNINRGTSYVICQWDSDRWGLRIFITPVNPSGTAGTHVFYDIRKDGFEPEQYPDNHGPISALVYDGDAPNDRALLLGGRTGLVQKLDEAAKSDDGAAINSYVVIGPANPGGPNGRARVLSLDLAFTEAPSGLTDADFNCVVTMLSDDDVSKAWNSAAARYSRSKTFSKWGRQTRWIWRQLGCYFYFKLANSTLNKTFAFNIGQARMEESGRTRSL